MISRRCEITRTRWSRSTARSMIAACDDSLAAAGRENVEDVFATLEACLNVFNVYALDMREGSRRR